MRRLSDNWPPGLLWPPDIRRPGADETALPPEVPPLPDWMALGADEEIADPVALCDALGVGRQTYYDVVRSYAAGHPRHGRWPASPSWVSRVMDALVCAGDARFRHPAYVR